MKKTKNSFLISIIILILLIFVIDNLGGFFLDKYYQSSKSGVCYQENYIMRKTNQDLLFFGSSRAAYHYIPSIFQKKLNMSVYNSGREGTGIYYHYGVLLATLKRYSPKVIVLDIDYRDLYEQKGIFDKDILVEHSPYYHKISNEFDNLLLINGKKEEIKLMSKLYRYNSKFFKIITGNLSKGRDNNNGFRPLYSKVKGQMVKIDEKKLVIDKDKFEYIQKFIDKSKSKGIQIIFSVSPYYKISTDTLFNPLFKIANKNGINYINHLNDERFTKHKEFFNDELHLNFDGAKYFSEITSNEILSILNKSNLK